MAEVFIVYDIYIGIGQLYSPGAERSRPSLLKFGGSRKEKMKDEWGLLKRRRGRTTLKETGSDHANMLGDGVGPR